MPRDICLKLPHLFFNALLSLILIICSPPQSYHIEAKNGDFSFDLVHRDSPKSPLHDPQLTPFERQRNAFQRSKARINYFASNSVLPDGGGDYLMKISYGTPRFETLAIIDTGSYLAWIQCLPCKRCYREKFPTFNPKNSSTFQFVPCKSSRKCQEYYPKSRCHRASGHCRYKVRYGDDSYTRGDLATETITLSDSKNKNLSFPEFVFGCGHDNGGVFSSTESGIVGFGPGKQSLVSQFKSSIQEFSYCLGSSESKPGKLYLGKNGVFSGDGVVSTPISLHHFYTLTLEGISVDGYKSVERSIRAAHSYKIIIDSGTTFTYLPKKLYFDLESTIKRRINSDNKVVRDPQETFRLCYSSLEGVQVPVVAMHFKGGADLSLNSINTFVRTSSSSICLAFIPTHEFFILGNIQQMNFWVGYDLERKIVSFKHADCTEE